MIDIEAFERDRKRRRAGRRKRVMLWAGATAGILIISLAIALPLIPSKRGPQNATGHRGGANTLGSSGRDDEGASPEESASEPTLPQGLFERIFALADPALPESTRDRWLAENNSTRDHWDRMMRMGREMIGLNYDVSRDRLPYFIASGASHIDVADCYPYEMEWRLVAVGGKAANDVPVSFLNTRYDGPFTHEMAIAAVKEFGRISQGDIDTLKVAAAMKDAETRFKGIRRLKPSGWDSWVTASKLPEREWLENPRGEYAIRVEIQEWQREEYTLEDGASEILIYFVYLPPNRKVDLTKVPGGGFQLLKAP